MTSEEEGAIFFFFLNRTTKTITTYDSESHAQRTGYRKLRLHALPQEKLGETSIKQQGETITHPTQHELAYKQRDNIPIPTQWSR
jgi:hypothetical protein